MQRTISLTASSRPLNRTDNDGALDSHAIDDGLVALHERAEAARNTLQRLRSEQAGGTVGVRPDAEELESGIDGSLQLADSALVANDLEMTRREMRSAERQLTALQIAWGGR